MSVKGTEGTFCHFVLIIVFFLQYGDTPLIKAAIGDHADTVKELLSSGATVDLANKVSVWIWVPLSCSVGYSPCLLYTYQSQSENKNL